MEQKFLKMIILKHKTFFSSQFDKNIKDLEREISNLPSEIAERRADMLSKLYNTQDSVKMVKSTLNQAANKLKSFCDELIQIYDSNDVSMRLLLYTAKKFVKYGNRVNEILKDALKIFVKINRELSDSQGLLKDFNAKLKERQEKINGLKENMEQIKNNITKLESKEDITENDLKQNQLYQNMAKLLVCLVSNYYEVESVCTFTKLVVSEFVDPHLKANADAILENIQRELDKYEKDKSGINIQDKLRIKIEKVQGISSALLSQVVEVKDYMSDEIDKIDKWQNALKDSIMDHEDISKEEIEFSIEFIKGRLIDLKNACDDYLNHKLPDILRGGAQSHITSPTVDGRTEREQLNISGPSVDGLTGEAQTNTPHPTVNQRSGTDESIISRSTANESWRQDLRCGVSYSLPDGRPGQCDPGSEFPCCSDQDWCGSTYYHCSCPKCIDYSRIRNAKQINHEPIPEIVEDPAWCQFINPDEACNDLMVAQKCKNTCNSEPIPEIVEDPAWCQFINPVEACNDLMAAQKCKNTCNSGKTSM